MENVRYMLSQYRSQTSLYFGHRFAHGQFDLGHNEGYMAGETLICSNNECFFGFFYMIFRRRLYFIEKSVEKICRKAFFWEQSQLHLQLPKRRLCSGRRVHWYEAFTIVYCDVLQSLSTFFKIFVLIINEKGSMKGFWRFKFFKIIEFASFCLKNSKL